MKDCLKPHRNVDAENQLKSFIKQIQTLMEEVDHNSIVENMVKEAAKLVKMPNRVLDLTVIEHYDSWTDIDGLVAELTMEVPKLLAISKEDFISIVQEIRHVIESGQPPASMPLDYYMNFYRTFFETNFPAIEGLFDEIFEDTSLEKLIELAFSKI